MKKLMAEEINFVGGGVINGGFIGGCVGGVAWALVSLPFFSVKTDVFRNTAFSVRDGAGSFFCRAGTMLPEIPDENLAEPIVVNIISNKGLMFSFIKCSTLLACVYGGYLLGKKLFPSLSFGNKDS